MAESLIYKIARCIAVCPLLIPAGAAAQIAFADQLVIWETTLSTALTVADFDSDGRNDLVFASGFYFNDTADYLLHCYRQTADGRLAAYDRFYYPKVYPGIQTMTNGDLNHDGRQDLVIAYADTVAVYFQRTQGFFDPVPNVRYYAGTTAYGLRCGDLNDDGLDDLATAPWNQMVVRVFYQKPGGGFQEKNYWRPKSSKNTLWIADMDQDGLNDLVVSNNNVLPSPDGSGDSISFCIYRQHPSTHLLRSPRSYIINDQQTSWNHMAGLAVADVNNDQRPDIVSANFQYCWVWLNDPARPDLFGLDPPAMPTYYNPSALLLEDLDGDGNRDIVMANNGWEKISVYPGGGGGVFDNYTLFTAWQATHVGQYAFEVADLNGDSYKDVAVILAVGGTLGGVSILYNKSGTIGTSPVNHPTRPESVSPNPSNGRIRLPEAFCNGSHLYTLSDASGGLVAEGQAVGGWIDCAGKITRSGIYFLNLRIDNQMFVWKVAIER